MLPVLFGAASLGLAALSQGEKERSRVMQMGPPRPDHVGPGFMAAVKDLGETAGKYPLLEQVMGPIFSQIELHHNEIGEPGYMRGFPINIPRVPEGTPVGTRNLERDALDLLQALAVLVGQRHGLEATMGVVKLPNGDQTIVTGFTTTPAVFWTGEIAMMPSLEEARQISRTLGGRSSGLPGFNPGRVVRRVTAKAPHLSKWLKIGRQHGSAADSTEESFGQEASPRLPGDLQTVLHPAVNNAVNQFIASCQQALPWISSYDVRAGQDVHHQPYAQITIDAHDPYGVLQAVSVWALQAAGANGVSVSSVPVSSTPGKVVLLFSYGTIPTLSSASITSTASP